MRAAIFEYKSLVLHYLPGEFYTKETLPSKSIAIDGIVCGSFIDSHTDRISFDHHSPSLPRHAQASSSKQIYDALVLGWIPPKTAHGKVKVYFNDIDLDSILSIYLLSINQSQLTRRVKEWVDTVNCADIFGPAYNPKNDPKFIKIRDFLYYRVLRKHRGRNAIDIITSILNNIESYINRQNLDYLAIKRNKAKQLFVLEKSNFIHPNHRNHDLLLMAILSEDPVFEEAYKQGADIVVGVRMKGSKYKYSIAKKHDFVPYDLLNLLDRIREKEKGWGGASSIIGSPDSGSNLSLNELLHLIKRGEWKTHVSKQKQNLQTLPNNEEQ